MVARGNNRSLLVALWAAYLLVSVIARGESSSSDSCGEEKHGGGSSGSLWESWFPSHADEKQRPSGGKAPLEGAGAKLGDAVDRGKGVFERASSKVQESAKDASDAVKSSVGSGGGSDWRERTLDTISEATPDWMSREKANDLFSRFSNVLSPDYHQLSNDWTNPLGKIMHGTRKSDLFSIKEMPEEYRVSVNVAGISPRNLNVTLSDHMLTVHGKPSTSGDDEEVRTVDHVIQLPSDADEPRIQATLKSHILSICIPRLCGSLGKGTPRKVAIIHQAD